MQDCLKPVFPQLLNIAGSLLLAAADTAATAGQELYIQVFKRLKSTQFCEVCVWPQYISKCCSACRSAGAYYIFLQEAMQALHTHLGSSAAREATAALGVLLRLSHANIDALCSCQKPLCDVLDYLSTYNTEQLHMVRIQICLRGNKLLALYAVNQGQCILGRCLKSSPSLLQALAWKISSKTTSSDGLKTCWIG